MRCDSQQYIQAAQTELGKPHLVQKIIGEGFTSQLQQSYLYEQQLLQRQQQQQLEGSRLGGHLAQLDTGQLAQSPQVTQRHKYIKTQIHTEPTGCWRGGRRADLPEPGSAAARPPREPSHHRRAWRAHLPEPASPREVAAAVRRLGQRQHPARRHCRGTLLLGQADRRRPAGPAGRAGDQQAVVGEQGGGDDKQGGSERDCEGGES